MSDAATRGLPLWSRVTSPELVMVSPRGVPVRNRLGAGLNDGWTVRAAPRWRWSRSSKSSFGHPTRVTGRLPEASIPHHASQPDQAGQARLFAGLTTRKPEFDFTGRRLRRIRPVNEVVLGDKRQVTAD